MKQYKTPIITGNCMSGSQVIYSEDKNGPDKSLEQKENKRKAHKFVGQG